MLKLNLASGQRPFDEAQGWTNVDMNPKWKPHVRADMREMPCFADSSAEMIVIHHGVEHVPLQEIDRVWAECHRILTPGGSLIVTVPDMWMIAQGWLQGRINEELFMFNCYGAYMDDEGDRHKWGYTRGSLLKRLRKVFASARAFDWREIPGAPITKDWYIAGVEAVK